MKTKIFEVRDSATFMPVLAAQVVASNDEQRYLLRRAGYCVDDSYPLVLLTPLQGGECHYDPYSWSGHVRTMPTAHQHITQNFDTLSDGDVICVETILGERTEPKISERFEYPI